MSLEIKTVSINRIHLDPENPRHESLPDQPSIIRHLINKEYVRNLAKDISEAGSLSPLEPIALIKHEKSRSSYIVVEGNRRICSLKLLLDPEKAGTEADRRYFSGLARNMEKSVSRVQAVIFDSRESATRWFALRHRGEQDGVGTKGWTTDQIARFNLRTNGRDPNVQALLLVEYAKDRKLLKPGDISSLSLTTLTRFLSTPVVRHAIGLADRNSILINVPDHEFERALTRFLNDSLDPKSGVNSRTSATDRRTYASKLGQQGLAAISHVHESHMPGTNSPSRGTDSNNSEKDGEENDKNGHQNQQEEKFHSDSKTTHESVHPDRRRKVISSKFKSKTSDKILKRLYRELKEIDAVQFTFAATSLLRSILEKSTSLYLISKGVTPEIKLDEKLKQLSKELASEGLKDRQLKILRVIAANGKDGEYAPDTLGYYIHGGATPTPSYVFRYWDNIEHIVQHMLDRV